MKKAYLLLGRAGDICNFLPVIKLESDLHGYIPKLIVAKDYADILEGCSYVDPVIYDGNPRDYKKARIWLSRNKIKLDGYKIIDCSLSGNGYQLAKRSSSFVRESWRLADCPLPWGELPLIFDKRDAEREKLLTNAFAVEGKHIILTALNGSSSLYKYADKLLVYLLENLSEEFQIIDISNLKAIRFYDLIGLFEKAHCLITIDSGPLHLAHAVPEMPVISLISDLKDQWHQSAWRPQHTLRLTYSESYSKFAQIAIAASGGRYYEQDIIAFISSKNIFPDKEESRRIDLAERTRKFENEMAGKLWIFDYYKTEGSDIPYVKQMIDQIANTLSFDSIIMICNADICFVPGITGWILDAVRQYGAAYFHRHDFKRLGRPYIERPFISESQVKDGKWYPGSDAFVFRKSWWEKHRSIFPDMLFAREAWDMIMRNMIKRSGGTEIFNAIYHEKHPSFWESKENRNCQENVYNRQLAKEWLDKYGGDWNDWRFTSQQLIKKYKNKV
jgi:hypothetical protein